MRRSKVRILLGSLRSQVFEVSLFLGKNKVELQWQVRVVLQQPTREVAQVVAHLVWDQRVAGSNPVFPTNLLNPFLMSKAEKILYMVMYTLFTVGTVLAIARNEYGQAIWVVTGFMWMHNSFTNRQAVIKLQKELEN